MLHTAPLCFASKTWATPLCQFTWSAWRRGPHKIILKLLVKTWEKTWENEQKHGKTIGKPWKENMGKQ